MKKHFYLLKTCLCALAVGVLAGCSAEVDNLQLADGMGAVKLSLNADTGFETTTKAVDESSYMETHPLSDYTVQILKGTDVVNEWKYSEIPEGLIELDAGAYQIIAFDGEEYNKNASTQEGIYMYGETAVFNIDNDQVEPVSVNCKPGCGKLIVKFGEDMATYFSDYSVSFKTKAAGAGGSITWAKDNTDPYYVKLDKAGEDVTASFSITKSDGSSVSVDALTRTMKWGNSWTITVNPSVESGKVGITITINPGTNDETIDIEIPSDWL